MRSAPATPAAPAAALPPLPWPTVGVGAAAMFVLMGVRTAFGVLYPAMVADLDWSVADVTAAFSAGLLLYAPAAVGVGVLVDRIGCRATMLGGCAFLIVGMVFVAASSELWQFYVAFVLAVGVGSAGIGFITVVKMLSMRAPARFPTAFGLASMGQGIGALLISPALQAVIDQAGWRAGALAFAGLVAVGLLPLVAFLAPGPEASGTRVNTRGGEAPAGVMSREFVLFLIGNATLGYLMLLPTHQVAHLLEVGFSPMVAATTAGLWGAMTAVGGVIGGRALERWPAGRLGAIGTILFAAGMIALILDRPEAIWLGAVYVLAAGLGRGVLSTLLASGQTRAFAGPRLGRLTGLLDLGFGFGAFLGPWLTAVVHDREGSFQLGLASTVVSATIVAVVTTFGSRRPGAERGRMRSP